MGSRSDYLYGGKGADAFDFSNRSMVMDATADDFISWGGFANDNAPEINQCAA